MDVGANVLLAYWHYCNKSVYPFSKQCKDSEFQQLASLDENTMQFIRVTRDMVNEKSKLFYGAGGRPGLSGHLP